MNVRKKTKLEEFGQYLKECTRLLYWSFYKLYTLDRWLKEIHPELKRIDNPFLLRDEFAGNPALDRYASQSWWLAVTVPVLVTGILGCLYPPLAKETFDWLESILFLLGWLFGLVAIRTTRFTKKVHILFFISTFYIFAITINFIFPALFSNFEARLVNVFAIGVAGGATIGVAGGAAVGVAFGVAGGAAVGVAGGTAGGVAVGVAGGIAVGVAVGAAVGVAVSVAASIAFGVAFDMAFGVAGGISMLLGIFRVYFWIPELLLTLILFFLNCRGYSTATLLYFPNRFDEEIRLPLPFLETIIVDAYRENPITTLKTLDHLNTSTNQQHLAARAIVSIAADCLSRCRNTGDIITLPHEFAWIPTPPPPEIGETLPEFLEISQDVRAALEASSVYRQRELLVGPLERLIILQNTFVLSKNSKVVNRFGNTVNRWRDILETARETLAEQARASGELPVAYVAGNALDPRTARQRFKGRQDIFEEIETLALMTSPPVLLLYGGRRTGKTSTLKYLPERVESRLVPLLVDLQGVAVVSTLAGFAQSFAEKMVEAARRDRNLSLPDPRALDKEPILALQTWFAAIERTFPDKRFLLCLDEFERMEEIVAATGSRAPLNFIRHVLQHRDRWIVLFSGAHAPDELADYWSDYLINTRTIRIGFLRDEEARDLVENPIPDFPRIYAPESVDRILYWTRCQPFLVQLLCENIVDALNRDRKAGRSSLTVTVADVDTAVPRSLETGGEYFRELWRSNLNARQREFLVRRLAGEKPESRAIARQLHRKEILDENLDFQVRMVETYVRDVALASEDW